jgi:hypothetical protein
MDTYKLLVYKRITRIQVCRRTSYLLLGNSWSPFGYQNPCLRRHPAARQEGPGRIRQRQSHFVVALQVEAVYLGVVFHQDFVFPQLVWEKEWWVPLPANEVWFRCWFSSNNLSSRSRKLSVMYEMALKNSHRCGSLSFLTVRPSHGNTMLWRTSAQVWTPHERGAADCS